MAEAGFGHLDERLAVVAQLLRRAVAERGEDGRVAAVCALEAERGQEHVAGSRAGRPQRPPGGAGAGGRERRWMPERQVAAHHRNREQPRRPGEPVEDTGRVLLVRADQGVHQRERPPAHRPHVGDVRHERRDTRRVRVGPQELRADRLGAQHQEPVAVRDQGRVVAAGEAGQAAHEPEGALAAQPGEAAQPGGESVQVGHAGISSRPRE